MRRISRTLAFALVGLVVLTACVGPTDERTTPARRHRDERTESERYAPRFQRRIVWRADVGVDAEAVLANGKVIVSSERGLSAFSTRCAEGGRRCEPLWSTEVWTVDAGSPVVAGDTIYAGQAARVLGFRGCPTDGSECRPTSHTPRLDPVQRDVSFGTEVAVRTIAVSGGLLFAASVEAPGGGSPVYGRARVYAFPEPCESPCRPLWRSPVLAGTPPEPIVRGGMVYVTSASGVHVFAEACRGDGGTCEPIWTHPAGMREGMSIDPPLLRGDVLLVSGEHNVGGGDCCTARIAAFPVACELGCDPLWTFRPNAGFLSLTATDSRAYAELGLATGQPQAVGIDLSCIAQGHACEADWASDRPGTFVPWGEDLRYVGHAGRNLGIFPERCASGSCRAERVLPLPRHASPRGVAPDGTAYFVQHDSIYAVPERCTRADATCPDPWIWRAPGRIGSGPVVWRDLLFVTVRGELLAIRRGP